MPRRLGSEAKRRMSTAALQLFNERGYDAVSAAEIAAGAGVTERTFFRHFNNKREVLFDGEAVLRDALLLAIAAVPANIPPLEMLLQSIKSITPVLEANRSFAEPRQQLIDRTPVLAERELAKLAALTATLAGELTARGVNQPTATMAAHLAMGIFTQSTLAWLADPELSLERQIEAATTVLKSLLSNEGK
jgi:AcrR family transcriptional regulator